MIERLATIKDWVLEGVKDGQGTGEGEGNEGNGEKMEKENEKKTERKEVPRSGDKTPWGLELSDVDKVEEEENDDGSGPMLSSAEAKELYATLSAPEYWKGKWGMDAQAYTGRTKELVRRGFESKFAVVDVYGRRVLSERQGVRLEQLILHAYLAERHMPPPPPAPKPAVSTPSSSSSQSSSSSSASTTEQRPRLLYTRNPPRPRGAVVADSPPLSQAAPPPGYSSSVFTPTDSRHMKPKEFFQTAPISKLSTLPAHLYEQWQEFEGEYTRLHAQERWHYYRSLQIDIQHWIASLMIQLTLPATAWMPLLLLMQHVLRRLAPDFPVFHHLYSFRKFQEILYRLGKEKICKHLRHTRFYGVAFDTYTTTNLRSILGCTMRFHTIEGKLQEMFIGCVTIDSRGESARQSVEHIKWMLKRYGVNYYDMISATFDGASVNLGALHSIGAALAADIPHIHICHCFAPAFVGFFFFFFL
jgi:hypothetical protein